MPIQLICLFFVLFSAALASAAGSMTCYSDGCIAVREAVAVKGLAEVPLAAGLLDGTLKVDPAAGTTIVSVNVSPSRVDSKSDKELETLTEQRRRLDDRLRALDSREEIFKAAAKSQSGKAPRKTKSNPDPMQAIRQGTDFAITQLETVYTARRKAEQEIAKLDAAIAVVKRRARSGESSVRVNVTPAGGRITVRYATSERVWQPYYNMHLTGDGFTRLQFSARIAGDLGGYQLRISPASLAESTTAPTFPVLQGGKAALADYLFPITGEKFGDGIYNNFSGLLTNTSSQHLPAGEAGLFNKGTYLGKFRFEGVSSGRNRLISFGTK